MAEHRFMRCFLFLPNLRTDDLLNKNLTAEQSFANMAASKAADPEMVTPPEQPVYMLKRIGNTTYKVAVHFSSGTKETAGDKIACLIRNEGLVRE